MVIKLIASDIDGTIASYHVAVSERVIDAFRKARNQGIHTIFVTGRSPSALEPLLKMGYTGPVICSNGAALVKLERQGAAITTQILEKTTFNLDHLKKIIAALRETLPETKFSISTTRKVYIEDGFDSPQEFEENAARGDMVHHSINLDMLEKDGGTLLIAAREITKENQDFLTMVKKIMGDSVNITLANPLVTEVTIVNFGVNKARSLAQYAQKIGVEAHEVLAFGDMPNDLEMLKWAGHGYAMGNAHPEVKCAITLSAPPVHEDGVAQIIESYLAENSQDRKNIIREAAALPEG